MNIRSLSDYRDYRRHHMSAAAIETAGKSLSMAWYKFIDEVSPLWPSDVFHIVMVIFRETEGRYGHSRAALSYTELQKATGKSRTALGRALKKAIGLGAILVCEEKAPRGKLIYTLPDWSTMRSSQPLTSPPVGLVETPEQEIEPATSPPVGLVLDHHADQNQSTMRTRTRPPCGLVTPPQPRQGAGPRAPNKRILNVELNVNKNVAVSRASGELIDIEKQKEKEEEETHPGPDLDYLQSLWFLVRSKLLQDGIVSQAADENWLAPLKVAGSDGNILYLHFPSPADEQQFTKRFAVHASDALSRITHRDAEVRGEPAKKRSSA